MGGRGCGRGRGGRHGGRGGGHGRGRGGHKYYSQEEWNSFSQAKRTEIMAQCGSCVGLKRQLVALQRQVKALEKKKPPPDQAQKDNGKSTGNDDATSCPTTSTAGHAFGGCAEVKRYKQEQGQG